MFDKLKEIFKKSDDQPVKSETVEAPVAAETKPKKPRKPRAKKPKVELSEKEKATQAGEPYVNILSMDINPEDINSGAFELDWNDKFVINLIKAGYRLKPEDTDQDIVDRWFTQVCKNVVLEVYEQEQADPEIRGARVIQTKDIGDGRSEVS